MLGMSTRTAAQAEASRINGGRSRGPATAAGRAIVSLNSVKSGLSAPALLLPHERAEDYEAVADAWMRSLAPSTPAEARLVARVADCDFRLDRLRSYEEKLIRSGLEAAVAETAAAKSLREHTELATIFRALEKLVKDTLDNVSRGRIEELLPTLSHLVDRLAGLHPPSMSAGRLSVLTREAVLDQLLEDSEAGWKKIGGVAGEIALELETRCPAVTANVEAERERLLEERLMSDDKEARRLDRHRAALQRELDHLLASIRTTRELVREVGDRISPHPSDPIAVELRLVGPKQ